jgi:hypothetical protein
MSNELASHIFYIGTLELLAVKKNPQRPLAPATEKSYGEAGVLHGNGLWRAEKFSQTV